ncbi:MAG: ATP-binding cassette domain-containing protein [Prevotellaceae bacterium]|jgi:molybdate transport system ATP-binding protein|nr:ATP-binding cassette domain-containing protein [Prevotellaceae bacterium]
MSYLIKIKNAAFRKFKYLVFNDLNWEMYPDENWAVVGANGSGKTTFLEILEGRLMKVKGEIDYSFAGTIPENATRMIASVHFSDPSINCAGFYYQQRYNASETGSIITVRNFLKIADGDTPLETEIFDIGHLLDTEIIKLSNGQFKKMMITKALLKKPKLLLIDNLYTGLDRQACECLSQTVNQIIHLGTNVVTVADRNIPEAVTNVMEIENFSVKNTYAVKNYIPAYRAGKRKLPEMLPAPAKAFETAVKLDGVNIVYNDKTIINQVKWTVLHGEKWALTGANGAGKSMLLSIIFADNPQAYANNIVLFDRKRGTGESIWDIKDNIGFVSPEMHLYFGRGKTCSEVALSGLSENPHRKIKPSNEIMRMVDRLFDYFSISEIRDNPFRSVSTGQQNISLLIRALVKNPPMLVLDEPFQGMDFDSIDRAKQLLDDYCSFRTLIFVSHRPDELPACINKYFHLST